MNFLPPDQLDRNIYITGPIDQDVASRVIKRLIEMKQFDKQLCKEASESGGYYVPGKANICINSQGGEVYSALAIYDILLKYYVNTIIMGEASSCALIIALAGTNRYALANSTLMIHSISNEITGGLTSLKDGVTEAQRLQTIITDIITTRTYIAPSKLQEIYESNRDWIFNTKQAIDYGVIHDIWKLEW